MPSPAPAPSAHPPSWMIWLGAAVIALAGFASYAGSLDAPFVFDDVPGIIENQSIRNLGDLGRVLLPPAEGTGVDSRPVVNLSLALNHAIGGLDPRGYRLTNVVIHVLGALALFGLVRRTLAMPGLPASLQNRALPVGFATALLWTVHPLQTETVICVIQRTEGLASLWYLVTLYCFARAVDAGGHRLWLPATGCACLLGMASKEILVSAPLMLFLYDRTFAAGSFREAGRLRGRWHLAFAATWVLLAALVLHSGGDRGGTSGFGQGVSAWTYLLTQARALTLYLKLSFWPHPLILDYGDWLAPGLREVFWEGLLVVTLLGATIWAVIRRPGLGFVGAVFFAVLAPSSSVYPLVSQTIAEHRMHLPLAAVLVLAVLALFRLPVRVAGAACLILAVAAGLGTARRGTDYRDELVLWTDLVQKTPSNAWARIHLGKTRFHRGEFTPAFAEFRAAAALKPDHPTPHIWIGMTLEALKRLPESVAPYQRALELEPANADARFRLGVVLLRTGRTAEARHHLEEVVRQRPDHANAVGNLGAALYQLGHLQEALPQFERVLVLNPNSVEASYNLALLLLQLGRPEAALPHLEKAAALRPQDAEIQASLARLRAQLGGPRR